MPIISAVVASRICDMEHKGSTWKMLVATNVERKQLYAAKYICINSLMLYAIFAQILFIIVFGLIKNFPDTVPIGLLIRFIGGNLLTTLAIIALPTMDFFLHQKSIFCTVFGYVGRLYRNDRWFIPRCY